jgi:protein SCO1/2
MNEVMKHWLCLILLAVASLAPAGCSQSSEEPPLQGAAIGGPFALTDQNGRTVRDSDFAGRYRLIYFGYASCPDVCPTDLQVIGQALTQFEKAAPERGRAVQPIFISVDPERDTTAVLKDYVGAFHPRLIGLTGPVEQIREVAKKYGIYFVKQDSEGASSYLVDHSRQTMLFGPGGEPIALVPSDEGAKAVVETLDKWVK